MTNKELKTLNYETISPSVIPHLMRDPDPPSSRRNLDSRLRGNDNSSAYPREDNSSAYPREVQQQCIPERVQKKEFRNSKLKRMHRFRYVRIDSF